MADRLRDNDLTHIKVGGKDYNIGFSRNNYDDDEKAKVASAATKAEVQESIADTNARVDAVNDNLSNVEQELQEQMDRVSTSFDGGNAYTQYGGARIIDCGNAFSK